MAGGKGKSIGGKGAPGKDAAGKTQKSHSAKAGLQVSCLLLLCCCGFRICFYTVYDFFCDAVVMRHGYSDKTLKHVHAVDFYASSRLRWL